MTDAEEVWRPVRGYEGKYEVSDLGRVRSIARTVQTSTGQRRYAGRILSPGTRTGGHHFVILPARRIGFPRRNAAIHQLVLEAFVGARPPGMEACHADDNKANNRLSNLRWDTRRENTLDRVRNGIHHLANKTACPKGHEYSEENTYITTSGGRACRACISMRSRKPRD
jgi:hypothetical protein